MNNRKVWLPKELRGYPWARKVLGVLISQEAKVIPEAPYLKCQQ